MSNIQSRKYIKNKNEIAQVSNIMITHDSYVTHR